MVTRIKNITPNTITPSRLPLVIGYFSCVHVMHAELFSKYHHYNVLTFTDYDKKKDSQIYSFKERIDNIARFKPDNIFIYDLNKYNMIADDFIQKVLNKIQPSSILVGNDFRFGSDEQSHKILNRYFRVDTINYNPAVSSTKISQLLRKGEIEQANNLLFFPYSYSSKWIAGAQKGRTIGIRTINLLINRNIFIPEGSYVSKLTIGRRSYKAVTFYGKSLVFNSPKETLETHVIGRTIPPRTLVPGSIKDHIKVEFLSYIRPPFNFPTKEELTNVIKNDIKIAKHYFERNN